MESFVDASVDAAPVIFCEPNKFPEDVGDAHCLLPQRASFAVYLEDWLNGVDLSDGFPWTRNPPPGTPTVSLATLRFEAKGSIGSSRRRELQRVARKSFDRFTHRRAFDYRDRGNKIEWEAPRIDQWQLPLPNYRAEHRNLSGSIALPQSSRDAPLIALEHWISWVEELRAAAPDSLDWQVEVDGRAITLPSSDPDASSPLEQLGIERPEDFRRTPDVDLDRRLSQIECNSHLIFYPSLEDHYPERTGRNIARFATAIEDLGYGFDLLLSLEDFATLWQGALNGGEPLPGYVASGLGIEEGQEASLKFEFGERIQYSHNQTLPMPYSKLQVTEQPIHAIRIYVGFAPEILTLFNGLPGRDPSPNCFLSSPEPEPDEVMNHVLQVLDGRLPTLVDTLGTEPGEIRAAVEEFLLPHALTLAHFKTEGLAVEAESDLCPDSL